MSFRLRVLALITMVAVTATGATAWITLRQANHQVAETATADQRLVAEIADELLIFGRDRGGWDDVAELVGDLSRRTGQRIHVSTGSAVVADSDLIAGQPARPVASAALVVDPRPRVPAALFATRPPHKSIATAIERYHIDIVLARCMAAAGAPSTVLERDGEVIYLVQKTSPALAGCSRIAERVDGTAGAEHARLVTACGATGEFAAGPGRVCLEAAFEERIALFAPPPVQVRVGIPDSPRPGISPAPIALAAAAVALVVLLGALLLSRRVLRPIRQLTHASTRLGIGDLGQRVPALGGDELGRLGRAFNDMAERLERSEQRQRHLVADVAHELRTPLQNLRGYLEALKDGVITGDAALFASLHEEAMLQSRIVDDLRDLALAEAGQLTYRRETIDVDAVVESCVAAHRAAADVSDIRLGARMASSDASVADGAAVRTFGDPDRLRQAFGNLIRNALAATPRGGSVMVTTRADDDGIVIEVADTGQGIAPEDLPHIFDRFWRADHSRARASGGAGLGLAIVRQIVADHHGSIAVESAVGVGTTVTVRLESSVG